MNRYGLTPSEVYFVKDLLWKIAMGLVILLILAWLAPHLWHAYGPTDACVDWASTNPTNTNVIVRDCETP